MTSLATLLGNEFMQSPCCLRLLVKVTATRPRMAPEFVHLPIGDRYAAQMATTFAHLPI